jgi:hypothetical protein
MKLQRTSNCGQEAVEVAVLIVVVSLLVVAVANTLKVSSISHRVLDLLVPSAQVAEVVRVLMGNREVYQLLLRS